MTDNNIVNRAFEDLLKYCNRSNTKENKELLQKGFRFADNAHRGVKRKSGLPYILHPIAVAKIVASEIGLGTESVVVALLHDVVEDTHYTIEDIKNTFGEKIAYMVDGLTKIDGVFETEITKQAENFKKMLLTLSNDIRVILIKIADRLHNMRTLEFMAEYKQVKIASETLTVFVPLAYRFGLRTIRKELEALSFKYLNKKEYDSIEQKILSSESEVNKITSEFSVPIKEELDKAGYNYQMISRQKSIYTIWRKMQEKDCTYEELFDKLVVRIIFTPREGISEVTQCWDIHHKLVKLYKPDERKTKDWINYPKSTGYQALHVTVMSNTGHWIEVQICSTRMDEIAEHGTTSNYWKNRQEHNKNSSSLDKWLDEIKVVFENPESDALSFLDDFKLELYYDEIQIFTPKGDIISLPKGATIVDFAYKIHSDIGNKCIGAKVNKKLQPPNYRLSNGEQVEILTLKTQVPQENWLDFVVTARAKTKLKSIFKDLRLDKIKKGQRILESIFTKNEYPRLESDIIRKLIKNLKIKHKDNLYLDLANRIISEKDIKKAYLKSDKVGFANYFRIIPNPFAKKKNHTHTPPPNNAREKIKTFTLRDDKANLDYKIAKCCHPIPGDEVIAYKDINNQMIVHKKKCSRILQLSSRKNSGLIPVKWETRRIKSFIATISAKGVDSHGVVSRISNIISNEHKVNMKSISITGQNGLFNGEIEVYVPHIKDLNNLIQKLLQVVGMIEVKRKEQN